MDRFIAKSNTFRTSALSYLKSSMDRFIENIAEYQSMFAEYLKSSMDRFIVITSIITAFPNFI